MLSLNKCHFLGLIALGMVSLWQYMTLVGNNDDTPRHSHNDDTLSIRRMRQEPTVTNTTGNRAYPVPLAGSMPTFQQRNLIGNGSWSQRQPWVWTDEYGTINTNELVRRSVPRNFSIAMYGSSHLREVYFQMLHLERGQAYDGILSQVEKKIASGAPDVEGDRSKCDPWRTGGIKGLYGVDLVNCGRPTFRVVHEMGGNVAISFKTFLHTPDADALFQSRLQHEGMYYPDVLVVDIGIWGARGNKMGPSQSMPLLTPTKEIMYYIEWVRVTFNRSHIAWVVGGSKYDVEIRSRLYGDTILAKDRLLRHRNTNMPCVHGCGGPVTRVLATRLLDWMQQIKPMAGLTPTVRTKSSLPG
jgi:hypothetical protein